MAGDAAIASVVGTTNVWLSIDRISADEEAGALLGFPPEDLLGRSLLTLVDAESTPHVLTALAQGFTTRRTLAAVGVGVRTGRGVVRSEAVILPMAPAPASAFAIFPDEPNLAMSLTDLRPRLDRFIERIAGIDLTRPFATARTDDDVPGISDLTEREREIVSRVIAGDRAPAIAEALFLSPNTVRNHLSSVYRKLGVHSQQELVDFFRVRATE
jgi:DNA-binding CsgD family transcriptional regulator